MSYGIIRVQKFKASDVRGIQSHDRRERDPHTNPDIDRERSAQNYTLVESPNFRVSIQGRLETLKTTKAVRKDAVVMCQFLVTSDHQFFQNLTPEKQKAFFQNALQFIGDRYGKENIVAATVHMDEKTPHMHVNMTPIRDGRLTAKEIFTRSELITLQDQFHAKIGASWGLERGQSREERTRHMAVADYKLKTQTEAQEVERQNLLHQKEKLEIESSRLQVQAERLSALGALKIHDDDFTQKIIGEKKTFLTTTKIYETLEQTRARIENDYLKPIEYAKVIAEKEAATLKTENQKLQKRLEPYEKIEDGLKPEQIEEIQAKASIEAQKYRHTNAAEAKLTDERQKFRYELLNTKRLGGLSIVGEQMKLADQIMAQWDKAQDKQTFESDVRERFCKSKSKGIAR